jgi:protoheme IX farnesyltransferase
MLAVIEPEGRRAGRQALWYAIALFPVSTVPSFIGMAGVIYLAAAVVLGAGLVALAAKFNATRSEASARALFIGSIVYLPLLWIVLVGDKL